MTKSARKTTPAVRLRDVRFAYDKTPATAGSAKGPGAERGAPGFVLSVERFEVEDGERWALYGPSGSGKTTLLNLIAGELVAQRGEVEVASVRFDLASEAERRAHRIRAIGFVFQDAPLLESLDVVENVLLPYRINPALELSSAVVERARSLAAELGLSGRLGNRPSQLSTGERQRACLARALVAEPTILLADEPTAGLDQGMTDTVLDLLEARVAEARLTLLLVTHDPAVLGRFENRVEVRDGVASPSGVAFGKAAR